MKFRDLFESVINVQFGKKGAEQRGRVEKVPLSSVFKERDPDFKDGPVKIEHEIRGMLAGDPQRHIRLSRGSSYSLTLAPDHQKALKALKHGEEHRFEDETNTQWRAHRDGDNIHFRNVYGNEDGSQQLQMKASELNPKEVP